MHMWEVAKANSYIVVSAGNTSELVSD
jgi:hypothetical protein